MRKMLDRNGIDSIYRKYLGREVDSEGLRHFEPYPSLVEVERVVLESDEFRRNDLVIRAPQSIGAWKICVLEEAKLVFVPIAKNAHTSILSAFAKFKGINWKDLPIADDQVRDFGSEDERMHYALASNHTGLIFRDYSPAFIDSVLRTDEYLRVAVFREPVARVCSAVNHFFLQERNNPIARKHSGQILELFANRQSDQVSDNDRAIWIRRLMKTVMCTKPIAVDTHWAPQFEYVRSIKLDYVLPIERLDLLEKIVVARSGKTLEIERRNVRDGDKVIKDAIDAELRCLIEECYWIDQIIYENAKRNVEVIANACLEK